MDASTNVQVPEGQGLIENVIERDSLPARWFHAKSAGHDVCLVRHDVISPGGRFPPVLDGEEANITRRGISQHALNISSRFL
jgi:hypothetical protein